MLWVLLKLETKAAHQPAPCQVKRRGGRPRRQMAPDWNHSLRRTAEYVAPSTCTRILQPLLALYHMCVDKIVAMARIAAPPRSGRALPQGHIWGPVPVPSPESAPRLIKPSTARVFRSASASRAT